MSFCDIAMTTTIPCPASIPPIQLTDKDVGYEYIEFPDDTIFLESMSSNTKFKPHVAFVPAQRVVQGKEETHLYEITPGQATAKHIAGPLKAPDGSTDVTVFGSALTSQGLWYLCAFNRNSILCIDLANQLTLDDETEPAPITALWEVPDLPSPNDACFDPAKEHILYVVGGTFRSLGCGLEFSNSAKGQVFRVDVSNPQMPLVTIQADGLKTLAGVEVVGDKLWLAQLYDLLHQPVADESGAPTTTTVAWQGGDQADNVWLADNIDVMDVDDILLCPAYSTVPAKTVQAVLQRGFLMSAVLFYYQVSTAFMRGEKFREAIRDPEVSLSFSNTYVQEGVPPAPVRLILIKNNGDTFAHFEVDLVETRAKNRNTIVKDPTNADKVLGERYYFNEQVTHTGHLRGANGQGFLCCVNFECPRILLLKEDEFLKGINKA